MPGPRLLAKLTRPRLHGAVARERLFAHLDDARWHRAAICVVGPPGAGKTTLVASWLDARAARGIWYQVDAGDGDLATFFHYLGQAAASYGQKGQPPLPALTPEYLKDVEGFSRRFFRELFARLPDGAVLVLDNYQEVGPEQPLHALVAQAVDEVPDGVVLVAISRRDPPDTYARLIANEHVAFVDWDQLKLTLEEARAIAGERLALDDGEIALLHEKSGGWAAGLTLLVEGRRRGGAQAAHVPAGRDAIFDYFAGEIFGRVPEATQRFLVATALLPQVPVSIARELTENPQAAAILEDLYHRHLFTHRRPGPEPVYWYHALFRDFLKARATAVLGARRTGELLSRAARLLEAAGAFDDAFELFREAIDWPAAGRLIRRRASDLLAHGRGQTLREWIQALPEGMLEEHPWLRYWLGTSLVPVDQPDARGHLERAFGLFAALGDRPGQCLAAAGIIETYFFEWADFRHMRRWVDALDGLMDRMHVAQSSRWEQRVVTSMILGMLYSAPDHPRIATCVTRATEMLDEDLDVDTKLTVALILLSYCNLAGDMERAHHVVARGSLLAELVDVTPFPRMWWQLRLGNYHVIAGRYEAAIAAFDVADEIAETHGFRKLVTTTLLIDSYRVLALAGTGDLRGMLRCHDRIRSRSEAESLMGRFHVTQSLMHYACVAGRFEAALETGRKVIDAAEATGMTYVQVNAHAHYALALAGAGEREALQGRLGVLRRKVHGTCFAHFALEASLVEAWDELVHGDIETGRAMLRPALRASSEARNPFINIFRSTPIFRAVLAEACEAGIEVDYVTDLIRRYRIAPPENATHAWPWPVKVFTLGRFEVHVDGMPLAFSGKAPKKPLTLLKALATFGGVAVPASKLVDALWPDEDGDDARKALDVNVARLRKLLGSQEAVVVSNDTVGLNPKLCWIDAHAFLARSESPDGTSASDTAKACALYAGTFLPGDLDAPGTVRRREQLRERFIRLVEAAGAEAEANGAWDDAIHCYRRGIESDELAEHFHQGLMRCYRALGRHAEAMSAYRRLRQTLSVVLGIPPSGTSQALARTLQSEAAARTAAEG